MTQLQVYLEERQEDQEEMHERRKARSNHTVETNEDEEASWLANLAATHPARHQMLMDWLHRCADLTASGLDR